VGDISARGNDIVALRVFHGGLNGDRIICRTPSGYRHFVASLTQGALGGCAAGATLGFGT